MVPKCKMEAAVGSGYRVVAGRSLELALRPPLRTRWGGAEARPGAGSSGGGETKPGPGRRAPLSPAGSSPRS